jgi:hypothetical protein
MLLIRNQPGNADRAPELLGEVGTARELSVANVERRALPLGICRLLSRPTQTRGYAGDYGVMAGAPGNHSL